MLPQLRPYILLLSSPSKIKEVKGTDFPDFFLPGTFHMLSDFPLKAEIQMFSAEEAAGVAYILHHLKDSL